MPVIQPAFLRPPDLAGDYTRGLAIGAQVKESQQRIAAEQARTQMEAKIHADVLNNEKLVQQQRLATETAYRNTQLELQKARLDEAAKVNAAKTREAALVLADKHGFAQDLQAGMPLEQALYRHPRISSPAAVESAQKAALDLGTQRLNLRKSELDLQQQREDRAAAKAAKPPELKTRVTYKPGQDTPDVETEGPISQMQQQFGTNLPATLQGRATGDATGRKIRVKGPDGKTGFVPSENLEQFLANGYTRLQ